MRGETIHVGVVASMTLRKIVVYIDGFDVTYWKKNLRISLKEL